MEEMWYDSPSDSSVDSEEERISTSTTQMIVILARNRALALDILETYEPSKLPQMDNEETFWGFWENASQKMKNGLYLAALNCLVKHQIEMTTN